MYYAESVKNLSLFQDDLSGVHEQTERLIPHNRQLCIIASQHEGSDGIFNQIVVWS